MSCDFGRNIKGWADATGRCRLAARPAPGVSGTLRVKLPRFRAEHQNLPLIPASGAGAPGDALVHASPGVGLGLGLGGNQGPWFKTHKPRSRTSRNTQTQHACTHMHTLTHTHTTQHTPHTHAGAHAHTRTGDCFLSPGHSRPGSCLRFLRAGRGTAPAERLEATRWR